MSTILAIETATTPCSVALIENKKVLFSCEKKDGPSHASVLGGFVNKTIEYAEQMNLKIEGVAVSCGPGSYTGLRIGISFAKGLCYGKKIPLIPISTLELLASTVKEHFSLEQDAILCPMIDARRMEVYSGLYGSNLDLIEAIKPEIIDENSYLSFRTKSPFYFFGDGSDKARDFLKGEKITWVENSIPLASNMGPLIEKAIESGNIIEDPAYYEPFYLKQFVATKSKKKFF